MKKKVIIVDDEFYAREHLNKLLKYCENIDVSSLEGFPELAVKNILETKPEILFLDVEMPRMSGFDLLEKLHEKGFHPTVIFTTAFSHYAIKAIKQRAFDYLLKPIDFDELKATLNRLIKGNDITQINTRYKNILSKREMEILQHLLFGKTSREIGNTLFISKTTVDKHRRNILEKTGAKSTTELISTIK